MSDHDETYENEEEEIQAEDAEELEDIDFEKLFGLNQEEAGEEIQEEQEQEQEQEEEQEQTEEQQAPYYDQDAGYWIDPNTNEKLLMQSQVNDIVGNARIKGRNFEQAAAVIQEQTGLTLDQVAQKLKEEKIQEYADQYGMDFNAARQVHDDKEAKQYLEQHLLYLTEQQQVQQQQMQYNYEKNRHINNPMVKRFEKEIDDLSQNGRALGFELAMNQVIGEKFVTGELKNNMEETVSKRLAKRSKPSVSPEVGGGAGYSQPTIPQELSFFAHKLGEDPKEVFEEHQKIQKEKNRGFL